MVIVILLVSIIVLLAVNALALFCVAGAIRSHTEEVENMTEALDKLTAQVAASNSAVDSAITLINTLADEIRNNVDDSDALNALADSLNQKSGELANAVVANTPQSSAPAPVDSGLPDGTSATPPVEPSPTGEVPPADVPPSNPDE